MSQIYVSGPWSFASGVQQVVKSIKAKSKGLGIYTAEIDDNLTFKGIADNFYQIINNQLGSDCVYLKGELTH